MGNGSSLVTCGSLAPPMQHIYPSLPVGHSLPGGSASRCGSDVMALVLSLIVIHHVLGTSLLCRPSCMLLYT